MLRGFADSHRRLGNHNKATRVGTEAQHALMHAGQWQALATCDGESAVAAAGLGLIAGLHGPADTRVRALPVRRE